jgi:anti-sigma factor RsiW
VDVVDPVLAEIRRRQRPVRPPTPAWLARFALVAAAPAAVVLVMTIQLIFTMTDPLNGLFMAATFIP